MKANQQESFELNKILHLMHKRKWLIFGCLVGAFLPILCYNYLSKQMYVASTTIVFEEQKGPAALINPFRVSLNQSFIINQIEEIKSLSLSEEVVQALPRSIINTFKLPKKTDADFIKEEYIAKQIQKRISVISVPNSEVIKIKAEACTPIASKVIANMIADVLKKEI